MPLRWFYGGFFYRRGSQGTSTFTLGHKSGNVIYRKKGLLVGDKVERQCDEFSDHLNLVRNPKEFGEFVALEHGKPVYV